MLSILNKTQPADMKALVSAFFGDSNLTRIHPVMGILSSIFGESDMLSYAPSYLREPNVGRTPIPLMLFSGINDSFSPTQTHNALMRAAGLPIVGPLEAEVVGVTHTSSSEVSGNINGTTAGALQFTPPNQSGTDTPEYDGHFIIFEDANAQESIRTFLESAKTGTVTIKR